MNRSGHKPGFELTPELKAWLDRVIVPALVREYLAELDHKKELEGELRLAVESPANSAATAEGG